MEAGTPEQGTLLAHGDVGSVVRIDWTLFLCRLQDAEIPGVVANDRLIYNVNPTIPDWLKAAYRLSEMVRELKKAEHEVEQIKDRIRRWLAVRGCDCVPWGAGSTEDHSDDCLGLSNKRAIDPDAVQGVREHEHPHVCIDLAGGSIHLVDEHQRNNGGRHEQPLHLSGDISDRAGSEVLCGNGVKLVG
mgnify:CR=1 FL=1